LKESIYQVRGDGTVRLGEDDFQDSVAGCQPIQPG